ncbi:efflux RND transporter periplasmic adaptor subunit [Stappia stellulata]|uniref:efflux RND transporter periplasmic adaptor subunit n=1 Tax=Stappia stellulata TaxID=71235 RepID=UPI0004197445|nr:efflux RND transporter periplasmic adaptor subunit [Stappia stellulata]
MTIRFSHILAVAITAAVAGWMWTGTYIEGGRADAANATPPPAERSSEQDGTPFRVAVRDIAAEERSSVLVIRGRTEAEASVAVRAETTGRVAQRKVAEGQRVERDDVLCVLDKGARQAKVLEAEARLAQAKLDHSAATQLQDKGFTAQTRVAALKAAMDAAAAMLEEQQLELSRTVITAPIGGVVESPMVETGTILATGQVCATLIDADPVLAIGQVSERDVGKLEIGQAAEVELVTGETVNGAIRYIAPAAEDATRTFRVEIEIANPDGAVRDGITATARVPLAMQKAHRLSSGILTLNDAGTLGVRAVTDDNTVVFHPVTILGGDTDGIWVSGLPQTLSVITAGQDYVIEGQTVEAVRQVAEMPK